MTSLKKWNKELKVQLALGIAPCYNSRITEKRKSSGYVFTFNHYVVAINKTHAKLILCKLFNKTYQRVSHIYKVPEDLYINFTNMKDIAWQPLKDYK